MFIYHLSRVDEVDWDEFEGFVVVAHSEEEARKIAHERDKHGEHGGWIDSSHVSCVLIGRACSEIGAGVILDKFIAG